MAKEVISVVFRAGGDRLLPPSPPCSQRRVVQWLRNVSCENFVTASWCSVCQSGSLRTVARKFSIGGAWPSKIWQKLNWFIVFHVSIWGGLSLPWRRDCSNLVQRLKFNRILATSCAGIKSARIAAVIRFDAGKSSVAPL